MTSFATDIAFASVLFFAGGFLLAWLARCWGLSIATVIILLPILTMAGQLLHAPFSPLQVVGDGEYYTQWGYSLAEAWTTGSPLRPKTLWPGKGVWPLIIGLISVIFGPVVLSLITLNALIVGLTAIVIQKTIVVLGARDSYWLAVFALVSSAPILLFGPSLLREAFFWLGASFGVLAVAYAGRLSTLSAAFFATASTVVLLAFRPDVGVALAYGFVGTIILLVGFAPRGNRPVNISVALFLLASLAFSAPAVWDFLRPGTTGSFVASASADLSNPSVTTAFSNPSQAGDSWAEVFCGDSLGAAVLCNALKNAPNALFGPFPWEYGPELIWIVAGLSTIHFLVVASFAFYYLVVARGRRWPLLAIFSVATLSLVLFSSILTNYGILMRFRAATEIILLPVAIAGFQVFFTALRGFRPRIAPSIKILRRIFP